MSLFRYVTDMSLHDYKLLSHNDNAKSMFT